MEYTYDVYDRRIRKVVDLDGDGVEAAIAENFVYDGDHIALVFDENENLTHRYLHGPNIDQVLAEETADGEVRWALTDHQGSVRDVIDNDGVFLNHITYDSFGNITSETDGEVSFRFSYTGREFDEESGQYFYRARYYDAAIGRFINEDTIGFAGGDPNLFRYVGNSPLNYTDPSGNEVLTLTLVTGVVVIGEAAVGGLIIYYANQLDQLNNKSSLRDVSFPESIVDRGSDISRITLDNTGDFNPNKINEGQSFTPVPDNFLETFPSESGIDLPNFTTFPNSDGIRLPQHTGHVCEQPNLSPSNSGGFGAGLNPRPLSDYIFAAIGSDADWNDFNSWSYSNDPVDQAVEHILRDKPNRLYEVGVKNEAELRKKISGIYNNPDEIWTRDRDGVESFVKRKEIFINNPANPTLIPARDDYKDYLKRDGSRRKQ